MLVKSYPYGPLASNMYVLETCSGIFIVDPSVYPDDVVGVLPSHVDAIICTHGHFDHINAIDRFHEKYPDALVFIDSKDHNCLGDSNANCSAYFMNNCNYSTKVNDFSKFNFSGFTIINTPGHTPGSVCVFYSENDEKIMFTGDTLFNLGIGRTDFPGGSDNDMMLSLSKLKKFDFDTVIYPGHGSKSTLGYEVDNNPYL